VRTLSLRLGTAAAALSIAAALTPAAARAKAPLVSTGGADQIKPNSANLNGTVAPKGEQTTYYFEYGPTQAYGARTAVASAGNGSTNVKVAQPVTGLNPNAVYHYRLIAQNASGTATGNDRTFTTDKVPLAFSRLHALHRTVRYGRDTTISGTLTGTDAGNRPLVLQQRFFPFTAAWGTAAGPVNTTPVGSFSFHVGGLVKSTQYRVRTTVAPHTASELVTINVAAQIATHLSSTRVKRGKKVKFNGSVTPATDGSQFAVQRRTAKGRWVTVAGGRTTKGGPGWSRFHKAVRITRAGLYRIYVRIVNGQVVSAAGAAKRIRLR
jgi:hypothetical protein